MLPADRMVAVILVLLAHPALAGRSLVGFRMALQTRADCTAVHWQGAGGLARDSAG
jgi:hypothetical protein